MKLEEQREEIRLREMADAGRTLKSAETALADARRRASTDGRRPAQAWDWELAELSHARVLSEVRHAEKAVATAAVASQETRERYTAAHSRTQAVRRVADARAAEIVAAREGTERRELDELAILRFGRRSAA